MLKRVGVLLMISAGLVQAAPQKKAVKAPPPAEKPPEAQGSAESEPAAPEQPQFPKIDGPKLVDLGNGSEIDLPAGMFLVERAAAQDMLRKRGSKADNVVAIVATQESSWHVIIEYDGEGHVTDTDANELDPSEMLQSYKDGTEEMNKRRAQLGIGPLFIDGWLEKPRYEKAKRELFWGINAHTADGKVVNSFTRILGRTGFLSVNLIDDPDGIAKARIDAAPVLAGTRFKAGSRYEDFNESTDKSSGIGLRGLVLGGAGVAIAAKGGFFLKLILVLKKGIILVFAGIAAFFKKITGRKKKVEPDSPE